MQPYVAFPVSGNRGDRGQGLANSESKCLHPFLYERRSPPPQEEQGKRKGKTKKESSGRQEKPAARGNEKELRNGLLTIGLSGSQSALLVSRLILAMALGNLRPCARTSLVYCCGYLYPLGKRWSPVCDCTHNPKEIGSSGLELSGPFSCRFRCRFESLRAKHSVPLVPVRTYLRFLLSGRRGDCE